MQNTRYYQKCITFGRAAEGLRADFQKQLLQLQREIGFPMCAFTGFFTTTWRFTASVNAAGEQSTGVSAAESVNPAGSGVAARLIRSPGRCAAR